MPSFSAISYGIANSSLLLLFFFWFQKKVVPTSLKSVYTISFAWKLFFTLTSAAIFYYYFPYQTDPKALFKASLELKTYLKSHPERLSVLWTGKEDPVIDYSNLPRAFFLVKILFFLNFLTGSNYWLDGMWLSTCLFFSAWILSLHVHRIKENAFYPCLISLLIIPTTAFWSSCILKETLGLTALCLLLVCFLHALQEKPFPWRKLVWALMPFYVLLNIRFYSLGAFLLVAIPYFFASRHYVLQHKYHCIKHLMFGLLFLLMGSLLNWACQIQTKVDLAELTFYTYEAYVNQHLADYEFPSLTTAWSSYWPYVPQALWKGLFSPLIWQSTSFFSFCEALINSLALVCSVICFVTAIKWKSPFPFYMIPILLYVLVSATFMAISSPNFGSLARYKTMYMPFFHYLLLTYLLKWSSRSAAFARFFPYFSGQKKSHL